jgi:type VI secretion system secreted protein VgrG
MATYTQANRPMQVATPLGNDALLLERFSGDEGVSMPFHFTLEMLSEKPAIDPNALLRKPVAVTLGLPGGGERVIHGLISRFAQLGRRAGLTAYRAEMVPWLWFLSLSHDCRIFQNLSVTEIAEQLFTEAGFTDFKIKLVTALAQRTYCVQYRESTLAFISRLFEEEGVFYYFEHGDSSHTLVLTDNAGQAGPCPVVDKLRVAATASFAMVDEPVITSIEVDHASHTGAVTLTSFDYEHPSRGLLANVAGTEPNEMYDYFGGYTEKADGDRFARILLEQKECERLTVFGESNCASLTSGCRFDLTEHPLQDANTTYHVLRVRHAAAMQNYGVGGAGGGFEYTNAFTAIPLSVPFRPARVTLRPIVHGTQTAIVTGPAGEEIYTDKLGRVKVHFHWDRKGKNDENSSCWVRVSSAWAGKGYGNFSAPRIGQEVIVDFLEGDPDQPIIVGRVYNGEQSPPCDPGGKGGVISGLRSKTHKGSGFNEMTMDDTAGKEKISTHAQYDMITTVGHDDTQTVTNNRTIKVDGTHTETIKGNTSITITSGTFKHNVAGGTADYHVSGAVKENYDATLTTNVTGETKLDSKANIAISAASNIKVSVGASSLTMDSGGKIELKGTDITINASKITLTGGTITSGADGDHKISGANVNVSGAQITSSATGVHTLTGAVVKIN